MLKQRRKQMKKKLKKEKGITLVALVVTIVVLLILAGITIMYTMGENSIFNKASEAKNKTEIAKWQERLEVAKGPVIIDGLGTFNPDKYFEYLQSQEIIEDKDTDVTENEDGTYDVTTKPGYIFSVELVPSKENPTDAKIEYVGEAGKITPIIKKLEVSATRTSITGKAEVVRLGSGTVTYYYKLSSEADIEYKEITNINSETGATQSTGITEGETYTIKAVAKNEVGETVKTAEITAKLYVQSITLDKTEATIIEDGTVKLTATVKPDDAEDKSIEWKSSNEKIATVDNTGLVTGIKAGEATITAKAKDGSNKTAECKIIVETNWELMNKVASAIASDSSITSNSTQATVTVEGKNRTINVGDIYDAKYNGVKKRVRVLGFKHDDLVDQTVYGGIHEKASISFEFYDCLGTHNMNGTSESTSTNTNGWAATEMRIFLEGADGKGKLSNNNYIKQVKKKYIKTYNDASSVTTSNDYLWLLSCSEVLKDGYNGGDTRGYAITKEGEQYLYYKNNATESYNLPSTNRVKYKLGSEYNWWLRSTGYYNDNKGFCHINSLRLWWRLLLFI